MKKILAVVGILFGLSIFSYTNAQEQKWNWEAQPSSLSISVGAPSAVVMAIYDSYSEAGSGLGYIGTYAIQYDYNVLKWLAVGARVSYEGFAGGYGTTMKDGVEKDLYEKYHRASALMDIRFTYINREKVQLYSGLGMGVSYQFHNESGRKYNRMGFAGYVTPIGIHVGGKNVYALAELGLGTEALMAIGVGFRL